MIDQIKYFQQKAREATVKYIRDYWLRRVAGAQALQKRLQKRAEVRRKQAQREQNENSFANFNPPMIALESKHPNGVIVTWEKPDNWNPDTYIVLVREAGNTEWRSVATTTITSSTRRMVLPRNYLAWGSYREPYEIAVGAVKHGVGRKVSAVGTYPPRD